MIRSVLIFSLFLFSFWGNAQVLENYDGDWKTREDYFLWNKKKQYDLTIPINSFPEAFLKFQIPSGQTLFIEGRLWKVISRDTTFSVPVKSLKNEFSKDSLQVSLIGERTGSGDLFLKISKEAKIQNQTVPPRMESSIAIPGRFPMPSIKDFYYFSFFLVLFLLGSYRLAYPYLLGVLLKPSAILNAEDFSESGTLQKFISVDILLFIFILGLMISQCLFTGVLVYREDVINEWIGWNFSSFLMLWLLMAVLVFLILILKFGLIRLFGYLFDMGKSDFAHFFYLLRLTVFAVSLINLINIFFIGNEFTGLEPTFKILVEGFFWIYLVGIALLFLIMMNRLSFKKYHLFTYLCLVEIVPFFILCKGIMVLGQ